MHRVQTEDGHESVSPPTYGGRWFAEEIPAHTLPDSGMPAAAAYQLIVDELNLDGNPTLNLASFVTTWMEPEADRLALAASNRNFIDHDEYPQTEKFHARVITMLGRLFHAPAREQPVGTATVGSSEAIMLGLLAHKLSWRKRRQSAGQAADRPNVVMGADVHTCWEKFAAYFDVEARLVPMERDSYTLGPEEAEPFIDENTIAVGAVMGTTYTGGLDDVAGLAALLDDLQDRHGWDIPIHVDAASGGFLLPFVKPKFAWDFRVPRVRSINVSNHKFGLVYPGMGSLLFRDSSALPDEMVFNITYLGGSMPNCSLNFSRSSAPIVLQYYNFLRLGREGYQRIVNNSVANAQELARRLVGTGAFESLSAGSGLPIVALRLKGAHEGGPADLTAEEISDRLRRRGWIIPAYHLPPNASDIGVLRMVVKENFGRELADDLVADIEAIIGRRDDSGPNDRRGARIIC
jgi:glutamate decarboxylase